MLKDEKANVPAYEYWRTQVLKRLTNKEKMKVLAPEKAPHPIGTKRMSLEQNFYELVDKDHVDIVDINENPIITWDATGIQTKDKHRDFDV